MQIHTSLSTIQLGASACALGMFDGVHVGHVMVLENALKQARLLNIPSIVVSFSNHPQFLISKTPTQLLSSLDERLKSFEGMGFDHALVLEFNDWLKNLSADDFIQQILLEHLNVQSVTVGYDHRFGKNRVGDGIFLKQAGKAHGFQVQIIDPVRTEVTLEEGSGQIVSSTLIRKLLSFGKVELANQLLGRTYHLQGIVEAGMQRGRQLGFPTANLHIADPNRLIPGVGTYAGFANFNEQTYPAVCNVGFCPTFGDQQQKRIEVHLLGYQGPDFYGERLRFEWLYRLRDEQRFENLEALVAQIHQDCAQATELLAQETAWTSST